MLRSSLFEVILCFPNVALIAKFTLQLVNYHALTALVIVKARSICFFALLWTIAREVLLLPIYDSLHYFATQIVVEFLTQVREFMVRH